MPDKEMQDVEDKDVLMLKVLQEIQKDNKIEKEELKKLAESNGQKDTKGAKIQGALYALVGSLVIFLIQQGISDYRDASSPKEVENGKIILEIKNDVSNISSNVGDLKTDFKEYKDENKEVSSSLRDQIQILNNKIDEVEKRTYSRSTYEDVQQMEGRINEKIRDLSNQVNQINQELQKRK